MMRRSTIISAVLSSLFVAAATCWAQNDLEVRKLNKEIDSVLRSRDLRQVAEEFAAQPPSSLRDQLKAIIVFARAGHRERVRDAVTRLSMTQLPDDSVQRYYLNKILLNAIDNEDLSTQRLFYERFAPGGDDNTSHFVSLWQSKGDVKELDAWLEVRARTNESWWEHWYRFRDSIGRADELVDGLAADIRANPGDWYRVQKYIRYARSRDRSWLIDVVPVDSSYNSYELATLVFQFDNDLAIKLFERSLELPFTDADLKAFSERAFRGVSVSPRIKHPEKQLRYWTLKYLATLYNQTNRPHLAQPFAERLTAMDTSGIQTGGAFSLAGHVQSASGQRVVESRILESEATRRESPQYWIERAAYYDGRKEPDLVLATFRRALEVFPYSKDDDANAKRRSILYHFARVHLPSKKSELKQIYRDEINASRNDLTYQFYVFAMLLSDLDELVDEQLVNTGLLPRLLASREKWRQDEEHLITNVMDSKDWDESKRAIMWSKLSGLVRQNISDRAYSLALSMTSLNAYRQSIPLLEACRQVAGEEYVGDHNFTREDVERILFDAYLEINDWRRAKKLYDIGHEYWGNELGRIAIAAAQAGDAENAVRLWEMNANLDRRKFEGLDALAKTAARPLLRDVYLKMKRTDPHSMIPDKALAILK